MAKGLGKDLGNGWTVYGNHDETLADQLRGPLDAIDKDCRWFARTAKEAKLNEIHSKLGMAWSTFCESKLHRTAEFVETVIRGVEILGEEIPIPVELAHEVGLRARHTAGPGRGHKTSRNTRGLGNSDNVAYILARLKRDGKSELLERIQAGELSAHAAAVEAGFRKRYIQIEPTAQAFASYVLSHFNEDQFIQLIGIIHSRIDEVVK